MTRLRYIVIAMALSLAFPLNAYAAVCSETDANGNNSDDILQGQFDQAILFGTNPDNNATQELGQSFTAPCDGHLDLFRTAYQAPDTVALSDLTVGAGFTVRRIPEELEFTPGLLDFLEDASIQPGHAGTVTASSPDGTTTVEIEGRHVGVGSFASDRILVTSA